MKELETVFMNKLCVVAKNKDTYFVKRLMEEVGQVDLFDPWSDFLLPEADFYLVRTTGIYRNDLDLMFIKSIPTNKVVNPYNALKRFRSKNSQFDWFEEKDVPCLPWMSLKGGDMIAIERFFRLYPKVVVKPLVGQGGWGIEALTWDEFKSWWKKKKGVDEDYLIQPLVRDARELRYFFIKGQSPIVFERTAKSGIVANFQREGAATVIEFPAEHQATIDELISASEAHYGAIDLFIHDDGRLSILELNTVPGIQQLEKVSGHNVMKLLLESLNRP